MSRRVLVSGASVAGNTTAFWLSRNGFSVDVIEKAESFRTGGQNVDVRGNGREVLRRMGLESLAFDLRTTESGAEWGDAQNVVIARFASNDSATDSGPTAELEIRRGDIAG